MCLNSYTPDKTRTKACRKFVLVLKGSFYIKNNLYVFIDSCFTINDKTFL